MSEILSQSEIDALLAALSSGEMNAEELKKEEEIKKVKVYDFKRALRFSKDQIRSLTRLHENFARLLTTYFSAQLRTFVQITVVSVDQLPYDEFIRSIPKMTILNIFEAQPLEGRMVLEVNPNITYAMLDRLLGGSGNAPNKIANLTEIESMIMEKMFIRVLDNFKEAWKNIIDLKPKLEVMEMNPQFMQIVSPNETVAVISLSTKIGDTTGMINLCLPHVVLEPVMHKLSAHHWFAGQKKVESADYDNLKKRIQYASLPIKIELGTSMIRVSDLIQLKVGDVIQLDKQVSEPLKAFVGETPKYYVQPGLTKGKLAVQIINLVEEGVNMDE
ncbi:MULTISPECIES: flagellar motor switch protein FliM [Tepidibacillus]|uniref:Flagellar motor switch protein FliM n=1 Tax=Tepidibacillus decaturensis TaxID=1413211 RepID=A0A135L327_9BACI|nr:MULTISPECIES: flagellar motor switch protein FliM [Tepidibacillus]KXG43396.1 flagellar motor switch protein FliM [Tepidibacillus decaturensis]GBF11610.1 flagellar motor switch protein FliM [Tepidibacillus sp. HK-1]